MGALFLGETGAAVPAVRPIFAHKVLVRAVRSVRGLGAGLSYRRLERCVQPGPYSCVLCSGGHVIIAVQIHIGLQKNLFVPGIITSVHASKWHSPFRDLCIAKRSECITD